MYFFLVKFEQIVSKWDGVGVCGVGGGGGGGVWGGKVEKKVDKNA